MTNQERQNSINKKYDKGVAKRGAAPWCAKCSYRMPKAGCRIKKETATELCLCATAYNRSKRV